MWYFLAYIAMGFLWVLHFSHLSIGSLCHSINKLKLKCDFNSVIVNDWQFSSHHMTWLRCLWWFTHCMVATRALDESRLWKKKKKLELHFSLSLLWFSTVFWFFFFLIGCFSMIVWIPTVFECLICMRFLYLYLHLFSATEHVSHGKAL